MSTFVPNHLEFLPDAGIEPQQLFILLHGVGGTPADLEALALAVRMAFPAAVVLVPQGFEPFDGGVTGRQWFSVRDISEQNRIERVAQAMPALLDYVHAAQTRLGLSSAQTALAGFSQGAIMALEALQAQNDLAGRVLAFSGRYAQLPASAPPLTTLHLLHGADDSVMSAEHAKAANERLAQLHGDTTIDIAGGVGHELHPALIQCAIERLLTCVPLRYWEEALGLSQNPPDGTVLH